MLSSFQLGSMFGQPAPYARQDHRGLDGFLADDDDAEAPMSPDSLLEFVFDQVGSPTKTPPAQPLVDNFDLDGSEFPFDFVLSPPLLEVKRESADDYADGNFDSVSVPLSLSCWAQR